MKNVHPVSEISERPWGRYYLVSSGPNQWVKTLVVNPNCRLSLQAHERRREVWHSPTPGLVAEINGERIDILPENTYTVLEGQIHRISNPTDHPITLIEIAAGWPDEDDIVRFEDDYGR